MKQFDGFSPLWPSVITVVTMICSFALLVLAMRVLPLGAAYTIWTGAGAAGAFSVDITVLSEQASLARAAAFVIVSGLVTMKLSSSHEPGSVAACHFRLLGLTVLDQHLHMPASAVPGIRLRR